jgi:hypothetical protein
VFDDRVRVHEVEAPVAEGQLSAVGDDEGLPTMGQLDARGNDVREASFESEFDEVVDRVLRTRDAHEEDGSGADTVAERDGEARFPSTAPAAVAESD